MTFRRFLRWFLWTVVERLIVPERVVQPVASPHVLVDQFVQLVDGMGALRGLRVLASGGGQLDAGLSITGLYEDGRPDGGPLDELLPCFLATRAVK